MPIRSPIVATDLYLQSLVGRVVDHGDFLEVRTPDNPGYYHGNHLLLPRPPAAADLDRWTATARATFADDDRIRHVCLVWDGGLLDDSTRTAAVARGFSPEIGVEMRADDPSAVDHDLEIRPLDPATGWPALEALNIRGDASEDGGDEAYVRFKAAIRRSWRVMIDGGHATWWGAHRDGALVGQCGMVPIDHAGERLGRFQAVEVDPSHRGQGIASALVSTVARHTLGEGAAAVVLSADPTGPALRLYHRLGFREVGRTESMVLGASPLRVRAESLGDHADVRSLVRAAFEGDGEADLVDALRDVPGAISLVAEQAGAVLGHVLFSPATLAGPDGAWPAVALAPLAVKPEHQRRGVGSALVEAGLDACRRAGHEVCVVLGHPDYYPRFGFEPAAPRGVRSQWDVPDPVFMVAELTPGALAGRSGQIRYNAAFDALP